jgi:methyltransferase-like protein
MLELKEYSILKLADNYVLYTLDIDQGMYWLFDIEEGTYFDLNEVSYFELSLFDGKASYNDICEKVISKYNSKDTHVITGDLKELLEKLHKKGIITELINQEEPNDTEKKL